MFRIIILVAIFLAVYPMIGNGYDQFMNDFNINEVGNFVSNMVNGLASFIDNFKSLGEIDEISNKNIPCTNCWYIISTMFDV